LVAVYLLSRILRSGSLLRWYAVEPAGPSVRPGGVARFWLITAQGLVAGAVWAAMGEPGAPGEIIRLSLGGAVGLVAASTACAGEVRAVEDAPSRHPAGSEVGVGMTISVEPKPGREVRRGVVGAFGAVLVLVGGLGFVAPDEGGSSTAPAYNAFHLASGLMALDLARRGRPAATRAFLVGFGAIDIYQALASHQHWFPESLFRWTTTDDRLHLGLGITLAVLGAWPRSRPAR
jgi:hypothetical protein